VTGLIAFLLFVAAFVVFLLRLIGEGDVDADWGFMFVSAGLALMVAGAAYTEARARQPQ
jgi:hypothetical protein